MSPAFIDAVSSLSEGTTATIFVVVITALTLVAAFCAQRPHPDAALVEDAAPLLNRADLDAMRRHLDALEHRLWS